MATNEDVGGVLGVKDSMIAHVLGKGNGGSPCPNATSDARKVARELRDGTKSGSRGPTNKRSRGKDSDGEGESAKKAKTKAVGKVETSLTQSELKAGLERNFSDLKIKKNRLRKKLGLEKLEKMAKASGTHHT
ncbi:hypothetical protein H0H93_005000 [Arthromyces matolae]|nr:hypothetical protein H0H93_005000 [Arthromyces matolae]